ncbi:MAG: class I adenylate-forming enzyme family protein [Pseudomonadota bacterium]
MHWREEQPLPLRREVHYGDRVVWCFAERPRSTWEMFAASVAASLGQDALVGEEGVLSYDALADRARRIAGGLVAAGLAPGNRVAILFGNRFAFVETWLACQCAGLVAVPMNPRQPAPEIAYAANQCGASAIIFDAGLAGNIPEAEQIPSVRYLWAAYGDALEASAFEDLAETPLDPVPVAEEDCATILYTSGTTGRPKGAMLTHLGIVHSSEHFALSMEMEAGDRSLLAVPASHVTGLIANITTALARGAAIVFLREFKAGDCLDLMTRERVTHTLVVPAMYNLFLRDSMFDDHDLIHWKIAGYGGAPMPESTIAEMARRAPHVGLMNGYGATEATSPTTMNPTRFAASHSDCVGLPLHCTEMGVFDQYGCEVPTGTQGEIWMRGPNVIPGYWDNPEANATSFVGGWWKSGDMGSMTEDGFVRVHDRIKDMVNRGGFKVFSIEVESRLSFHPNILESAVIGRPCEVLGERVHLVVVPKDTDPSDALSDDIRAFASRELADYKVPEVIHFRTNPLPRNANGKILKTELREEYT